MTFLILWPSLLPATYALPILKRSTDDKDTRTNALVASANLQLAGDTIVVRHAPNLNSGGRVEGSIRVLSGENINVNGATITSDLFVPGTPIIHNNGGNINYNGTVTGTGSTQPPNYSINLNSNTSLRHIVSKLILSP